MMLKHRSVPKTPLITPKPARNRARRTLGAWRLLACGAAACLLTACGQTVSTRVISGPAGVATVVDRNDPRMGEDTPGVSGASVRVLASTGGIMAEGVTDEQGRAVLSIPAKYTGRIRIETQADGYHTTRSEMIVPPESRRVLVVVQPR